MVLLVCHGLLQCFSVLFIKQLFPKLSVFHKLLACPGGFCCSFLGSGVFYFAAGLRCFSQQLQKSNSWYFHSKTKIIQKTVISHSSFRDTTLGVFIQKQHSFGKQTFLTAASEKQLWVLSFRKQFRVLSFKLYPLNKNNVWVVLSSRREAGRG